MPEKYRKRTAGIAAPRISARTGSRAFLLILVFSVAGCSVKPDYQKARSLDTPEAYEAFLDKHPDDAEYAPKAKRHLEKVDFEEARKQDTYQGYMQFLQKHPYGKHKNRAERAIENIRAEELGIHVYRKQPEDFYVWVSSRYLPYRVLVRSSSPDRAGSRYLEEKWYSEIERRGLFVPMDPGKTYPVSPDITLYVRETVIVLCARPLAFLEAEVRIKGATVQTYRIAADHIEQYLLYEIFKDRPLYDPFFRPSAETVRTVEKRFEQMRRTFPRKGSLALEFEITQQASREDQEMMREFVAFLQELHTYEEFHAYPRGHPTTRRVSRSIFLSINRDTHAPQASRQWRPGGSTLDWSRWNTKWILQDKAYFFKKMILDLLDLLASPAGR